VSDDRGSLPDWGEAELPEPPPFTARNAFRTVGPGVIGLGVAIGSGEWLLGPSVIVSHGPELLWITTSAVLLQVVLNLEMGRYTLYTGEPILTGFMRTRPGAAFWGWTYGALSFLQYGWPGWALASATATAALLLGRVPGEGDAGLVVTLGYATFAACFLIVLLSKKIERSLERAMWAMLCWIFAYLLVVDVSSVSAANWGRTLQGFTTVGRIPEGVDWAILGAFAAYSGLGGIGNAFLTNWMRDKGMGMGSTVGFITGAFAVKLELAPHGNVFDVNEQSLGTWRRWWKYLNVDQWGVFACGSILGMLLTALLTVQFVPAGASISGWGVASIQASAIADQLGPLFWYLTVICGFWILFSTQLGVVDGLPRGITDMLWSAAPAVRRWRGGDVRLVYFTVLIAFAVWGCIALNLAQPLTLIVIGANIGAVNFVIESIHTLVVNRTLLPKPLRPPLWREALLVLCALFYGAFVGATLWRMAQ
jgi:hypothetical protein